MDIAFGPVSICTPRADIAHFTTSRRQRKRIPPRAGFAETSTMTLDLCVREMRPLRINREDDLVRSSVPHGLVRQPIGSPSSRPGRAQRHTTTKWLALCHDKRLPRRRARRRGPPPELEGTLRARGCARAARQALKSTPTGFKNGAPTL